MSFSFELGDFLIFVEPDPCSAWTALCDKLSTFVDEMSAPPPEVPFSLLNCRTGALGRLQRVLLYFKEKKNKTPKLVRLLCIENSHLLFQTFFFPLMCSHPINFLCHPPNYLIKIQKISSFALIFFSLSASYWIHRVDYKLFPETESLKPLLLQSYLTDKLYFCHNP